jgi:hypothetical protein
MSRNSDSLNLLGVLRTHPGLYLYIIRVKALRHEMQFWQLLEKFPALLRVLQRVSSDILYVYSERKEMR